MNQLLPVGMLRFAAKDRFESPCEDPETQALDAIQRGDLDVALEVLMEAYGSIVYRYCRHLLGDADSAEEAHQVTFVQAYDDLGRFQKRSSLRTWLLGIARHRCLDLVKTRRRRERRFPLADRLPERPCPVPGPAEHLAARGHLEALAACFADLAPRVRDSILLRYQQGLSYTEMGRLSGEQPAALRVRVVRALPLLKRCLESKGAVP